MLVSNFRMGAIRILVFLLLSLYAAVSATGLVLIKSGTAQKVIAWQSASHSVQISLTPALAAGMALYVISFLLWILIIGNNPLTFAFPLGIGITTLFVFALSAWILREPIGALDVVGSVLILGGIWLVSL